MYDQYIENLVFVFVFVFTTPTLKPIFHKAYVGPVGADNAINFTLGAFQIFLSPTKISYFKKVFA